MYRSTIDVSAILNLDEYKAIIGNLSCNLAWTRIVIFIENVLVLPFAFSLLTHRSLFPHLPINRRRSVTLARTAMFTD